MINSDFLERAQWRGEAAKESQKQMEQMLETSSFAQTPQQVTQFSCTLGLPSSIQGNYNPRPGSGLGGLLISSAHRDCCVRDYRRCLAVAMPDVDRDCRWLMRSSAQ